MKSKVPSSPFQRLENQLSETKVVLYWSVPSNALENFEIANCLTN